MYVKEQLVLEYLLKNEYLTNAELQELIHVSRRTITNYINSLNAEFNNIIVSSKLGYKLVNKNHVRTILFENKDDISIDGYENREKYLIQKLMLNANYIDIDVLSDELCISTYTLHNDIAQLNEHLKPFSLHIKSKNNLLYLIGDENNKKKYVMSVLNSELSTNQFTISSIKKFFKHADLDKIRKIAITHLDAYGFYLDDFSLLNYVLHLAICIEYNNSQGNISLNAPLSESTKFSDSVDRLINDIYLHISSEIDSSITLKQIYEASILMSTRLVAKSYDKMSLSECKKQIGDDIFSFINELISSVYCTYGIDLNNDMFIIRFAFHLKNTIYRNTEDLSIPPNNFSSLKDDYPFLYYIASYMAFKINKNFHIRLSDLEISYIVLHLVVAIEETSTFKKSLNCGLLLYDYHNTGSLLFKKISRHVEGLRLTEIATSIDDFKEDNDFIISTLPITDSCDVPIVHISIVPTEQDLNKISILVKKLMDNSIDSEIEKKIQTLFKKDLFISDNSFDNRNNIIDYMCKKLLDFNYVDNNFKHAIWNHEDISSTAYRNIAIPHPLDTSSTVIRRSAIFVCICPKGIMWGERKVNFVFMLALKDEDKILFKELFNMITELLLSDNDNKALQTCTSFESFINLIIEKHNS